MRISYTVAKYKAAELSAFVPGGLATKLSKENSIYYLRIEKTSGEHVKDLFRGKLSEAYYFMCGMLFVYQDQQHKNKFNITTI